MRHRVEVSAIHLGLTAAEAYEVLRDFERHANLSDVVRSVRLERGDDGSQISFWEVGLRRGVLRWSQYDQLDDDNHRVRFRRRDGYPAQFEGTWSAVEGPDGCRIGFDGEFELGNPSWSSALDPVAARNIRESVTAQLEGIFGPALLVDRSLPREPAPTAGI